MADLPQHRRGDTWFGMEVSVTDVTDPLVPDPVDFTGASILFQVRTGPSRDYPLMLELSTEDNSLEIADAGATIKTTSNHVLSFPAGTYYAEMQATMQNGAIITVYSGAWPHIDDIAV